MRGSKNICGQINEQRVVEKLQKQKFLIIDRNIRTLWGEIDIVSFAKEQFHIFEVKSVYFEELDAGNLISRAQRLRLQRFCHWLTQQVKEDVRLHLATVSRDGCIRIYEDVLCDLLT